MKTKRPLIHHVLLLILACCLGPLASQPASAQNNGLDKTPPMGWNSWFTGVALTGSFVEQIADTMVSRGFLAAGYNHCNLDDGWMASTRDANNKLQPSIYFPPSGSLNGIQAVAAYVHNDGLKFGLYEDVGTQTCGGGPGCYGYYDLDAQTFASWGIDFIKMDWCNTDINNVQLDPQATYTQFSNALYTYAPNIEFNICEWGVNAPWTWAGSIGNSWRIYDDSENDWTRLMGILQTNAPLAPYAGQSHWNDPDYLMNNVASNYNGPSPCSYTQFQSQFGLWCEMAAPLILGGNIVTMAQNYVNLYTNPQAIAVDQDPGCVQGRPVVINYVSGSPDTEVWCKPLGTNGTTKAVILFNLDSNPQNITVNWSNIQLAAGSATVYDIWAQNSLGTFTNSYTSVSVPSNGTAFLKIVGTSAPSPDLALDKMAYASSVWQNPSWYGPTQANDGILGTEWASNGGSPDEWLEIDLGSSMTFNQTVTQPDPSSSVGAYQIQSSPDGNTWTTLLIGTGVAGGATQVDNFASATARYVRIYITTNGAAPALDEFSVYNSGGGAAPVITSALTATGTQGSAFSYTITATNNPTSFAASGLPSGLSVNSSTGVMSGTATASGTSTVALSAINASGTGAASLKLTMVPASSGTAPVITSSLTASAVQGSAFSYTITAANNPASFSASGLPSGLSVNTSTGVISGTASASGTTAVTLSAINAYGTGTATLTLTVSPAGSSYYAYQDNFTWSGALTGALPQPTDTNGNRWTETQYGSVGGMVLVSNGSEIPAGSGNVDGGILPVNGSSGVVLDGSKNFTLSATFTDPSTGSVSVYLSGTSTGLACLTLSSGTNAAGTASSNGTNTGLGNGQFNATHPCTLALVYSASTGLITFEVNGTPISVYSGSNTLAVTPAQLQALTYIGFDFNYNGANNATLTNFSLNISGSGAGGSAPVITSALTASGTANSAFNYQITATNSPTSYNATGLPAGLSVNTSSGAITGTPTLAGTSAVTLSAVNSSGTGTAVLTLTVHSSSGGSAPVITSGSTATGTVNSAFSYQITATNNPASFGATGLPSGLSVNSTSGAITGTPTLAGTSTVTLSAINSSGTGTATLTLTVNAAGSSYAYQDSFARTGTLTGSKPQLADTGSNTWTETQYGSVGGSVLNPNGTVLPAGSGNIDGGILPVNGSSGVVLNGSSNFTLTATFTNPTAQTVSLYLGSTSSGLANLALGSGTNAAGTATSSGTNIGLGNRQFNATQPCTLALVYSATTGKITFEVNGTPISVYSGSNTLAVTPAQLQALTYVGFDFNYNGANNATLSNFSLAISGSGGGGSAPVITSALTASGTANSAFNYQITATNSPTSYNATGLPAGLSVNTSSGAISGTPTLAGTSSVTLSAINSSGTGTAALTLTVIASGSTSGYQDSFARTGALNGSKPQVVDTNGNTWTETQYGNVGGTVLNPNGTALPAGSGNIDGGILPVNGSTGVVLNGSKNFTLSATFTDPSSGSVSVYLSGTSTGLACLTLSSGTNAAGTASSNGTNTGWGNGQFNATHPCTLALVYSASTGLITFEVNGTPISVYSGSNTLAVTAAQLQALTYIGFDFNYNGANNATLSNFTLTVGP